MDILKNALTILSIFSSLSAMLFAFLAFKRNSKGDKKEEGKNEGVFISDISYIKASIERIEKTISKLEDKQENLHFRMITIEQKMKNSSTNNSMFTKGDESS